MLSLNDQLLDGVAEVISRFSIAPRGTRLGVAVSGGADSVVLLHLLDRLAPQFGFSLWVLHVNHHLRGQESMDDEEFVRSLARELGIDATISESPIPAGEGNLEQAARDARRECFLSAIRSGLVNRVALGHTRSDQAETVLFRLTRGAGLAGLSGMRCVSPDGVVRPLLFVSRDEVRTWAASQKLTWREDSSNNDHRFRRNYIRSEILPRLAASVNYAAESALARTAAISQTEEDYWEEVVRGVFCRFTQTSHQGLLGDLNTLHQLHLAVQRRVIRKAILTVKGDLRSIDSAHVDAILQICQSYEGHDRLQIPGIDALRSYGTLRMTTPGAEKHLTRHYHLPIAQNQEIELPFRAGKIWLGDGSEWHRQAQNYANFINVKDRSEIVNLDYRALGGAAALNQLVIRNWEPGDQYQPVGHRSVRKVKELFQEHRVLLWERRHWPVLDLNGEIVWVRGFGPAAKFGVEQGSVSAVSLTYAAS